MENSILAVNNQPLQFTQIITLDSVCSGQKNAEHNEHLTRIFNAPRFLFPKKVIGMSLLACLCFH